MQKNLNIIQLWRMTYIFPKFFYFNLLLFVKTQVTFKIQKALKPKVTFETTSTYETMTFQIQVNVQTITSHILETDLVSIL